MYEENDFIDLSPKTANAPADHLIENGGGRIHMSHTEELLPASQLVGVTPSQNLSLISDPTVHSSQTSWISYLIFRSHPWPYVQLPARPLTTPGLCKLTPNISSPEAWDNLCSNSPIEVGSSSTALLKDSSFQYWQLISITWRPLKKLRSRTS